MKISPLSTISKLTLAALTTVLIAGCAEDTPYQIAMKNLKQSISGSTYGLASNLSCGSTVERSAKGIDAIKCSYEVNVTPLQRMYSEEYCAVKPSGKCALRLDDL